MNVLYLFAALLSAHAADLCPQWDSPVQVGAVDSHSLSELSGLVASRAHSGRFYAHNDSGNATSLFVLEGWQAPAREIPIDGYSATDFEDITVSPCGTKECVWLADTGDNKSVRSSVFMVALDEAEFSQAARPREVVELVYPDGAHNAEAVAIHPVTGDLWIVTKEKTKEGALPARVYIAPGFAHLAMHPEIIHLELKGSLPLPEILQDYSRSAVATALDFSPDGVRFLVGTYLDAIEFETQDWTQHAVIPLTRLQQQEAFAYARDGESFFYSTERDKGRAQPVYQVSCKR